MSLTIAEIRNSKSDNELVDLLSNELQERFPPEVHEDANQLVAALVAAPVGLRAMAAVHPLDVSMSLDDLAWHFGNHSDQRLLQETVNGLVELGATEAAELFAAAWQIVKPFLPEMKEKDWAIENFDDYLEATGIQGNIDPLNSRMWKICEQCGDLGLLHYWAHYARKHPERCV